jgi:hypothetical protein
MADMHRQILCFFLFPLGFKAYTQNYPQNDFRNPMAIKMELVANYGEIRTNHWHMGLDIRTQQRENLPVHAAAEGQVSRIVVEPGGFGQAIYIDHPNGFTTLYAHMNSFYPALARYVKEQQYKMESWSVDLEIPKGMFPLEKGDYIGRSGNTGGSAGPHVHFEIRDTKTEKVLNPLLFNFPIPDAVPPSVSRLVMYDRNKSTYHQYPQNILLKRSGKNYTSSPLRVGSDRISFAIGAVDRFSGSSNPNGIYRAVIRKDGTRISEFVLDNIDYDETRFMNAHIDYPWKARGGAIVQHISPLPGATGIGYQTYSDGGFIQLKDQEPHEIEIEIADTKNNTSRIILSVQYDPSLSKSFTVPQTQKFIPGQVNVFESGSFELFTMEGSLYDTVYTSYIQKNPADPSAISGLHIFNDATIPVHDSITVRLLPERDLLQEEMNKVIIRSVAGKRTHIQKAKWNNGWMMARFRQFGEFQAFVDNIPPQLNNISTNLTRAGAIVFAPTDNFKTIKNFRAELNGKWLMFSNDKGRRWIYRFDENFPRGSHELKVTVEDEAGNITTRIWNVRR